MTIQKYLSQKSIDYSLFAPSEKIQSAFDDIHAVFDELEDEITASKEIDESSKIKISFELEGILTKIDSLLSNIKIVDDRIIAFIREYKIKLGLHKTTNFAAKKKYENAIDSAKLLLSKSDKIQTDQIAHFREGSGYFDLGMYKDAIDEFTKALEIQPENVKTLVNLGWSYILSEKFEDAEIVFEKASLIEKDNIYVNNGLASTYFNRGKIDESINAFSKVIELSQDVDSLYFAFNNLGHLYIVKNDYETAIKKFQKAIAIAPDRIEGHFNLANIYYNLGLYNEALLEYSICSDIKPEDIKYDAYRLSAEGHIYMNQELYTEAVQKFKEVLEKGYEDPLFYNNLGAAYEKSNDFYKALKCFKKAVELNPSYQSAYVNIGYINDRLNETEEAIKYYGKAIELNQRDVIALNNLGWDLYLLKEFDAAENAYLRALKTSPENLTTLTNLGWLYVKKGDYNKALGVYQSVLELDPNYAMAYNDIGYLYYKRNMLDKAILELNKAIRLNTDRSAMTYAYFHLGLVYIKKKMKDEALTSFLKSIKIDETYLPGYYELGIIYKSKEEYTLALKNFDKCISINQNSKYAKKAKEQIKKINIILKEEVEN